MSFSVPYDRIYSGKVRDIYSIKLGVSDTECEPIHYLLFVTTDRLSCFDVVMKTEVPGKGIQLVAFADSIMNIFSLVLFS